MTGTSPVMLHQDDTLEIQDVRMCLVYCAIITIVQGVIIPFVIIEHIALHISHARLSVPVAVLQLNSTLVLAISDGVCAVCLLCSDYFAVNRASITKWTSA